VLDNCRTFRRIFHARLIATLCEIVFGMDSSSSRTSPGDLLTTAGRAARYPSAHEFASAGGAEGDAGERGTSTRSGSTALDAKRGDHRAILLDAALTEFGKQADPGDPTLLFDYFATQVLSTSTRKMPPVSREPRSVDVSPEAAGRVAHVTDAAGDSIAWSRDCRDGLGRTPDIDTTICSATSCANVPANASGAELAALRPTVPALSASAALRPGAAREDATGIVRSGAPWMDPGPVEQGHFRAVGSLLGASARTLDCQPCSFSARAMRTHWATSGAPSIGRATSGSSVRDRWGNPPRRSICPRRAESFTILQDHYLWLSRVEDSRLMSRNPITALALKALSGS